MTVEMISPSSSDGSQAVVTADQAEDSTYFALPSSFAQQRLWFLEQLQPGTTAFHIPTFIAIRGDLNVTALRHSLQEMIHRHEALRTTFALEAGEPVQHIAEDLPKVGKIMPLIVLSPLPDRERENAIQLHQDEITHTPFDLQSGPLWRFTLLQLADQEFQLLTNFHHIITDGWSMEIFWRELGQIYSHALSSTAHDLPELPLQYADYAVWQQERATSGDYAKQLAYWRKKLAGKLPPLNLPLDLVRPKEQSNLSQREETLLSKEMSEKLAAFGQVHQVSPFMTLLATFALLLHRLSDQNDLLIGTPIAGRTQSEVEGTIGCFLNTLALRLNLTDPFPFDALLALVRETTLEAYDQQEIPFELLLADIQPERDQSRTPIFQVLFNMLSSAAQTLDLAGCQAQFLPIPDIGSKFDLTFYVETLPEQLRFTIVYNPQLFKYERIQLMLAQFNHLLAQIFENNTQDIWLYSLRPPLTTNSLPNPQQLLPKSWHGSLQERFNQQANARPHKIAICDPDGTLTYHELQQQSWHIAHRLQQDGVQNGDVIAVYGPRSAALVTAVLGIIHAGAAFVILDPVYPPLRLQQYIDIAAIHGWIQTSAAVPLPPLLEQSLDSYSLKTRLILPVATAATDPVLTTVKPPQIESEPDDLAYLTFTSGTTGKPKAVRSSQRPLTHFFEWYARSFDLHEDDHFSMLSGLAHDPLLRDIFGPLLIGATLHIPDLKKMGPGTLARWIADEGITVIHLTPSMTQMLINENGPQNLPRLRYAFFGGESLTRPHVELMRELAPHADFGNFYGTTETPQVMGAYLLQASGPLPDTWDIPLGHGIDDVQLLLLNRQGQLAGVGEIAEIYVRTPYLSLGYLHARDNDRFISNPFRDDSEDRLYRTGDLGRHALNGNVYFAGREDRQVNLRGYRLELIEIEQKMRQHPDVINAHVRLQQTSQGETQLVAYYVPMQRSYIKPGEMRKFLLAHLPGYMVPVFYTPMPNFPLTANGKLNTDAFPASAAEPSTPPIAANAQQSTLETALIQIWKSVLGIGQFHVNDDFFELGGHSLLAIRLFTEIEKRLGVQLPIATIFQAPTIATLANNISSGRQNRLLSSLVPMQISTESVPIFFVHGGAGHVFLFKQLAESLEGKHPFYGLQPRGWDNGHLDPPLVTEMAADYIQQVRALQPTGPYYLGGFCFGGTIAMEMARQLENVGETVNEVILVEPGPPALHKLETQRSYDFSPNDTFQQNSSASAGVSIRNQLGRLGWSLTAPFFRLLQDAKGWGRSGKSGLIYLYLKLGRQIPPQLRDIYYLNYVSRKSWDLHNSQPIQSPIRLFLHHNRSRQDPRWRWMALGNPASTYHILWTDHFGVLEHPYVAQVAAHISA